MANPLLQLVLCGCGCGKKRKVGRNLKEVSAETLKARLPPGLDYVPPGYGAGIMAVWQVALVKQLRIMGSNPSQPHILVEGRRKAEEWRKAMGGRTGFSAP